MIKKHPFKAYTLSEIVIVMLIISVVVAVTIGVTKKKLESTVSYTYYSAYESLKDVSRALLTDFRAQDEDYMSDLQSVRFAYANHNANNYLSLFNSFLAQPAYASCSYGYDANGNCLDYDNIDPGDPLGSCALLHCQYGKVTRPDGSCYCLSKPEFNTDTNCKDGFTWNMLQQKCVCSRQCGDGEVLNPKTCSCIKIDPEPDPEPDPVTPDEPEPVCSAEDTPPACDQQCVGGQWQLIPNFSRECSDESQMWNEDTCACEYVPRTLPRNGKNFCEMIEQRVNTRPADEYCNGSSITSSTTDFKDKTPDIVLRNGMRLYNVQSNLRKIDELEGNKSGFTIKHSGFNANFGGVSSNVGVSNDKLHTTTGSLGGVTTEVGLKKTLNYTASATVQTNKDGINSVVQGGLNSGVSQNVGDQTAQLDEYDIDTGEYGYLVYVDIDGEKGSSKLWEDVYPFYMTLSGQVVPVYNTSNGNDFGGNSANYLQTSIQYEKINAQGRRSITWLAKSVSFQQGACQSGFLNSSTPYCKGISTLPECANPAPGTKCSLKTVKPIKFL